MGQAHPIHKLLGFSYPPVGPPQKPELTARISPSLAQRAKEWIMKSYYSKTRLQRKTQNQQLVCFLRMCLHGWGERERVKVWVTSYYYLFGFGPSYFGWAGKHISNLVGLHNSFNSMQDRRPDRAARFGPQRRWSSPFSPKNIWIQIFRSLSSFWLNLYGTTHYFHVGLTLTGGF